MVAPYKIMKTQTEYLYLIIRIKFDKYNAQEYNIFYFSRFIISTSVSKNFIFKFNFIFKGYFVKKSRKSFICPFATSILVTDRISVDNACLLGTTLRC